MPYGTVNADKITTSDGVSSAGLYGFKNRIINGDMRIDQRNAGASVTPVNAQYLVDRWQANLSQASKFTVQQNAGSVTPPAGFTKYLGVTSSSAYSVLTGDYFNINQPIEGFNIADLAWGTASAATVTLSFWARSSLTGTFGGALTNGSRSYPFTYTISSANTWEQKSITIAGDTSGTWSATNSVGVQVTFNLGTGATYSGTAGAWASANYASATGATSVVGTNGATFYITGVQLEKGSTATSFDYRDYGRELMMCQRYLPCFNNGTNLVYGNGNTYSVSAGTALIPFQVTPRVAPTGATATGTFSMQIPGVGTYTVTSIALQVAGFGASAVSFSGSAMGIGSGFLLGSASNSQIQFTGCEL